MGLDQLLPPGTILQHLYFKERLRLQKPGRFIEIGCGKGLITQILLDANWTGVAYDLNDASLEKARQCNANAFNNGLIELKNGDWLKETDTETVDLIISSLVLEHLDDRSERAYIEKCKASLKPGGKAVLFVPHSPAHWGIEDEIAGHYRRYTKQTLGHLFDKTDWCCEHAATLTYPLSNWLLPLGEKLVRGAEEVKLKQSMLDRTKQSGDRRVEFKTSFPPVLGMLLNELTMLPFHFLQKAFVDQSDALILYAEYCSLPAQPQASLKGSIEEAICVG
jgi:SAM-dependent methyltransferase